MALELSPPLWDHFLGLLSTSECQAWCDQLIESFCLQATVPSTVARSALVISNAQKKNGLPFLQLILSLVQRRVEREHPFYRKSISSLHLVRNVCCNCGRCCVTHSPTTNIYPMSWFPQCRQAAIPRLYTNFPRGCSAPLCVACAQRYWGGVVPLQQIDERFPYIPRGCNFELFLRLVDGKHVMGQFLLPRLQLEALNELGRLHVQAYEIHQQFYQGSDSTKPRYLLHDIVYPHTPITAQLLLERQGSPALDLVADPNKRALYRFLVRKVPVITRWSTLTMSHPPHGLVNSAAQRMYEFIPALFYATTGFLAELPLAPLCFEQFLHAQHHTPVLTPTRRKRKHAA